MKISSHFQSGEIELVFLLPFSTVEAGKEFEKLKLEELEVMSYSLDTLTPRSPRNALLISTSYDTK